VAKEAQRKQSVKVLLRSLMMCLTATSLTACANDPAEKLYLYTDRQPARYPLNFPVCYGIKPYVIAPLRIGIRDAWIPDPVQVMSLRKKDPDADGCFTEIRMARRDRVSVEESDSIYGDPESMHGWLALDQSGNGFFAASAYKNQLLNAKDLQQEKDKKILDASTRIANLEKLGFTYTDMVKQDETVEINGVVWHHYLTARYKVKDPSFPTQGELLEWRETYEQPLHDNHVLRRSAHYDAMIVADPEWIAARRNLLLKLVQAIRIEPMTKTEVDAAVAKYRQQREQDKLDWKKKH
jgi:hypothetical protein